MKEIRRVMSFGGKLYLRVAKQGEGGLLINHSIFYFLLFVGAMDFNSVNFKDKNP